MKIAYIIPSLANAGPIIVVRDLVKLMTFHNHQCVVFYFDEKNELSFNCELIRISFKSNINFNDYDLVHTHGARPDLYVFLKKTYNVKTVFISSIHSYIFEDYKYTYKNKFKSFILGHLSLLFIRRHDSLIVLSRHAVQYYTKYIPSHKILYAYNTRIIDNIEELSDQEKQELMNFKGDSILLGANCCLSHRKGIDQVIKILPHLEDYKLFLVGEGKDKIDLMKIARDLKVEDKVYFAGYKFNAYRYLKYYDVYVMPSRSEGFPLSLLEAASFAKNVVCSNIPIFKEVFTTDEVAEFVLDDKTSLINAIKTSTYNIKMRINIKLRFDKDYSPECIYDRYEYLYTKTIEQKKNDNYTR